ncbi:MAG: sulfatase [Saprospiraceae bacterium]
MTKFRGHIAILIAITGSLLLLGNRHTYKIRPNIIVFLVDDMGWQDCSVPFWSSPTPLNHRYHTPNMEKLAAAGMKFTSAYATPVCTPTRSSMLTGLNAAHHHITNWTSPRKNNNTDAVDEDLSPAIWNINGLSPVKNIERTYFATPFPQILQDDGYFTIHVGKAHWASAGTPGANPYNMGFMVNISGHAAGHPQSYLARENFGNQPGKAVMQAVPDLEEYYGTDTFLTEALTLEAIKSLMAPIRNKQPFFLNMAHYAVHTPIMRDQRYYPEYIHAGLDSIEAAYASLVEGMDKSLGDLMDFLHTEGVDKNTIIIFMSDNGGLSLAPPRGGEAHTQNLPLRAGKGSVYEGGIRVPMIVSWPGITHSGSTSDQYVMIDDFLPTILEMAKVKQTHYQAIDGKSIVPYLKNSNLIDTTRALIWHYPNKWQAQGGPGINYFSAIRKGAWKLVYNQRTGSKELYNLKDDIGEKLDLSKSLPHITNRLSTLLSNQLRFWAAPMPFNKTTGRRLLFPDEWTE